MSKVIALALKDLRLLPRVKSGLFFTFAWPIIITVLFGFAFGGQNSNEQSKPRLSVVDQDNTDGSRAFVKRLDASFDLSPMSAADAENAVRLGQRAAYIVLKPGFGEASERMFYGKSKEIELGVDPARQAEAGMIQGLLMKHASEDMQKMFGDPTASTRMVDEALAGMKQGGASAETAPVARFLTELKSYVNNPAAQAGPPGGVAARDWQPLKITSKDVARERRGPENAFDITFPQGVIWGLIGCVMTFGLSLVTERTHGTFVRLQMAPLTRAQILGGKALACFLTILLVELMLFGVATVFGVRPTSIPLLAVAGVSSALCFVGFMMLIASLGKTEQSAAGAGWAILMPLSMFGGAMVPTFVMPGWMQSLGYISPIRWAMLAIEGGVWRNFSPSEMVLPCAILITIGVACFAVGTYGLREA
jgi:linearmycin/streptolysin S transport system permease protein